MININELIKRLEKEIKQTQSNVRQAESLERLKEIYKNYKGDDEIITSKEVMDSLLMGDDEFKILTGWNNFDKIIQGFRKRQLITISGITKHGKCFKKGTEILMYDGTIQNVEDIKIGDLVMGEDSKAKKVLSLGRGEEEMFEIKQGNDFYIVNKSHILSLKRTGTNKFKRGKKINTRKGEIINISVEDYLKKSNGFKYIYKGWKTGIDFKKQLTEIEPYFLGLWLGDGGKDSASITNIDKEIEKYLKNYSKKIGLILKINENSGKRTKTLSITRGNYAGGSSVYSLQKKLRDINVLNNKHIPKNYLINNRENRLKLLAGLIDTDGSLSNNKWPWYEIIQKNNQLSRDIVYLAKSLGFSVTIKKSKKGIKSIGFVGEYNRIRINGDLSEIPILIKRKKSNYKCSHNILVNGIKIKSIGQGEYYGFELDGNGLFVLGNFIVTHNTAFCIDLTSKMQEYAPLWFPLEEGASDLVRKFLDSNLLPPLFYTAKNNRLYDIQWLETKIIESIAKFNSQIVFIDQLDFIVQLQGESHALRISQTMRDLKQLAVKWNVIIFLICHLNKAKLNINPDINDLRGSGSIAQESDTVIIIWRETKREKGEIVFTNKTNVSVQANRRFGKTGNIHMALNEDRHFYEQEFIDKYEQYGVEFD